MLDNLYIVYHTRLHTKEVKSQDLRPDILAITNIKEVAVDVFNSAAIKELEDLHDLSLLEEGHLITKEPNETKVEYMYNNEILGVIEMYNAKGKDMSSVLEDELIKEDCLPEKCDDCDNIEFCHGDVDISFPEFLDNLMKHAKDKQDK